MSAAVVVGMVLVLVLSGPRNATRGSSDQDSEKEVSGSAVINRSTENMPKQVCPEYTPTESILISATGCESTGEQDHQSNKNSLL